MNKNNLALTLLLITGFVPPLIAADNDLVVEDAWISEAPPVSKVMVAYMTITNNSDKTVTITKAESDLYSSIEFHETRHKDGMASMVRYEELTVPANGRIQLKRGGKHFMMFNPTKHLKAGDSVNIELSTGRDNKQTIIVPVKKAQY